MKVCEICGDEIATKDGDNRCHECEQAPGNRNKRTNIRVAQRRREREQTLRDCGLVKVRGAFGGTYWE